MKTGTLIYWQDGDLIVGRLRERADVFSQGRTMEELEANIKDALHMMEETDLDGIPPGYRSKEIALEA
jgi:predicted RNase H-like HicB family nuclease